jgi:Ser/Thr protein kinase RdoA (MazF antagonist)
VHTLLRHLEQVGFSAAPGVVGDGYDDQGREVLTWIPGRILHPRPYTEEQVWQVGRLLRSLHEATASFQPPARGGLAAMDPAQPRPGGDHQPL